MARAIHRLPLASNGILQIPSDAEILQVLPQLVQNSETKEPGVQLIFFVLYDDKAIVVDRRFTVISTGQPMTLVSYKYVGSVQAQSPHGVSHFYIFENTAPRLVA